MKFNPLTSVMLFLWFSQCSPDYGSTPKVNADQASIELQNELRPKLVGQWALPRVNLKYQDYNVFQKQLKISKDTSFSDLATITIIPTTQPRTSPRDKRVGEYDGTIRFRNKTYPIQFDLLAYSDWVYSQKGPQGTFLLMYKFPIGSHIPEDEETFLENIGLVGDNFILELTSDPGKMIWRGLNRGLDRIELTKL
ncbi:hypothetical protein GCM10027592_43740 [Spirosoma flavus]